MPVIALVGNKGGAGKTTLAVNLAARLAHRDSAAVLDADPQGSALQWHAIAAGGAAAPVHDAGADLEDRVARLVQQGTTHLVIDCPPSVHAPETGLALRLADVALIPVQPSPLDLWATVHIEAAVDQARMANPGLRALLLINQLEPRTTLSRLVRDALAELDIPVAATAIRRRAVYRASALEGRSVCAMGRRGRDAVAELDQLIEEVLRS